MPLETYGDIRKAVTADKLDWTVSPQFSDETPIVRRSLGAVTENLVKAVNVPPWMSLRRCGNSCRRIHFC